MYTQWLNERAGIEADLTVAKLAENRFLVMTSVVTGLAELKYLRDEAKGNSQVTITDISSSQAVFGLSGPRTREFLEAYADIDLSHKAFPFSTSQEFNLGPVPVRAQRISYTGELGWEVFVDASFAPYLFELLMSGESAVAPSLVGFHAAESLRTEKAFRHWGHDIGYTDTPYESGLMFTCKTKKQGGFKGMEQLEQRVQHSKERVLIQLLLEDPDLFVYHNEPILLNDTIVGSITTGSYGHSLGGPVGLGWIKLDETIDLSLLEQYSFQVLVAGKKIAAKVSLKPMYDPSNLKLRA